MSDDLNDLKNAMESATPAPDGARKAANLALAHKNFAALQGSANQTRPTSSRPTRGLWTGVRQMLNTFTGRAALTASTAIVAVGFVILTPLGNDLVPNTVAKRPVQSPQETFTAEADMALEEAEITLLPAPAPAAPDVLQPKRSAAQSSTALGSVTMNDSMAIAPQTEPAPSRELDTESFANEPSNPIRIVSEDPVSTFSIDVDTASYAVVRNSLMNGLMPPKDAVRVEEMVNYFTYDYTAPDGDAAFRPSVSVSQTPWNQNTQLVHIGLQGAVPSIAERPPLNLVFLIDTSGSMDQPNKLPLLKQSFRLMLAQLRPEDEVAIVTYAGSAGQVLDPTPAAERSKIMAALDNLDAGGSTAGQEGLQQAYATAAAMTEEGDVTRVLLATDGDFNVGLSDPDALTDFIAEKRDSGTYLSVLGFGRGNLDDATMQALAQNGNGQAAYIDTLSEAQKVLVDQLTGALFPIANDVKIQVEFNPTQIAEYRLIGYETRALRREDFNNDKIDAGDIGSGHQVTALYEVTPVGSPAQLTDPLRYGSTDSAEPISDELGFLRLRYKAPGASESQLIETPISTDLSPNTGGDFAAAIAGFGQLLRDAPYLGNWGYEDAIALANETKGEDPFGYRSEAVQLMRLASSLSEQP